APAPASLAFAAPTTNSYRRLVPGYEAPINLVYSQRNRSACVRIPVYFKTPAAKRLEFRSPDPSCNPYLSFAAMLQAGLDGVKNKIEPPDPIDKDLYDLPPEEAVQVKQVPGSLEEVLDAGRRPTSNDVPCAAPLASCAPLAWSATVSRRYALPIADENPWGDPMDEQSESKWLDRSGDAAEMAENSDGDPAALGAESP